MAYRRNRRGMGIAPPQCAQGAFTCGPKTDCSDSWNWTFAPACWSQSPGAWALQAGAVAPPPAPTGDVLTVPPASGADAQATVDQLVNQQMIDQQAHNAAGVTSSVSDVILGSGGAAIAAAAPAVPWLWIGLGVLGVFAATAIGGGSPRRYGR
jgi:hypothetical protein